MRLEQQIEPIINNIKIDPQQLNQIEKIKWEGTEKEIISLFILLQRSGLIKDFEIDEKYQWNIIPKHFINKKNEDFNKDQLNVVYQNDVNDKEPHSKSHIVSNVKWIHH